MFPQNPTPNHVLSVQNLVGTLKNKGFFDHEQQIISMHCFCDQNWDKFIVLTQDNRGYSLSLVNAIVWEIIKCIGYTREEYPLALNHYLEWILEHETIKTRDELEFDETIEKAKEKGIFDNEYEEYQKTQFACILSYPS